MSRAAQIYTFTLAANASQVILNENGFYKILSATGTVRVNRESGTSLATMIAGYGESEEFKRLTVTDTSGAQNTVTVLVADRSFVDSRVYGEVSVIDGAKARTLNNSAQMSSVGLGAVAGQYATHQLWNPAGSGKNVIIEAYSVSCQSASLVYVGFYNTQLTALTNVSSKLNPGVNGVAVRKYDQSVTLIAALTVLKAYYVPALGTVTDRFTSPLILPPNTGMILSNRSIGLDLQGGFEHYEENI